VTVSFIDANRSEFGVEPICTVLQLAPSTYYQAKARPLSDRAVRDGVLSPLILELWQENYRVYGAHKIWKALRREGEENVGRDQVARLMRGLQIQGARRGGLVVRTTRADEKAGRPPDLVDRKFVAAGPNELWVTDLTYVPTWQGVAYVCFITDVFSRRIVGWRAAANMRTEMVLDALEMACFHRGTRLDGVVCHSDAGSQFTSVRYTERLEEIGARPSIGSIADSYDNAMAETVNGLYKTELIRRQAPWKTIEDVELATLAWVHWFNTTRLHTALGDIPPAEHEANHYAHPVATT
jgi:putative transposase